MITFKTFIKRFEEDESPIGDLARDILEDSQFPSRATTFAYIYDYLRCKRNEKVIDTFVEAWEIYRKVVRA